ncbi:MAG: aldo/keto reductase [Nitriliruptor sp.]|nr:MAG: aldo/keto reductase [Nitriliruptor sp.]
MDRLAYGDTGLEVTPIGIGLAALGRPGYVTLGHAEDLGPDRSVAGLNQRTQQVLDHAYERGVRYLDVARSYGYGEAFLADWLARDPDRASTVTVGSKWGYTYVAGWRVDADEHEVKDHSLATFERQYAETRELLGAHLDLYQVHSASLTTGVLDDPRLLEALADLAGSGVVVGMSLSGPDQADTLLRALELGEAGRAPFRAVQATWNLLEPSTGAALAEAHRAGWGITVKEALANGRLTTRGDLPTPVRHAAAELGVAVDALAIAAALAQPWAHVVLSGATTVEHLDSNLAALDLTLPSGLIEELIADAEPPATYWERRRALAWN